MAKFGYKNLISSKKEGKVKGFFSLLIPTTSIGTIELPGFKVIEGDKGYFVSLPNRAVPVKKAVKVMTAAGQIDGTVDETKYFNNILFESQDKYNEFRKELNDTILPEIVEKLHV